MSLTNEQYMAFLLAELVNAPTQLRLGMARKAARELLGLDAPTERPLPESTKPAPVSP